MVKSSLIIGLLFIISSCCAPHECRPARDGFRIYHPVIEAVEAYKLENGLYPASLDELTPKFLKSIPLPENPKRPTPLKYERTSEGYKATFTYIGPGANSCTYTSKSKSWDCFGFY